MVDKILYLCTNYGGHQNEKRLLAHLENIRMSTYVREVGIVLVDTSAYILERRARNQPENDIVPMKLHSTALQKILYLYNMYSGHSNESKMKGSISALDFVPYQRNNTGETVLITNEDYMRVLQGAS